MNRLPQDAVVNGTFGVPDLSTLRGTVEHYAEARSRAVDFEARVNACWGLVARGTASLDWCRESLRSGDADLAEDAVGVLASIGCPAPLATKLRRELSQLPAGPARDALKEMLARRPRDTTTVEWEGVPLRGEGEPFTSQLDFVEAPYERFVAEHAEWLRELGKAISSTQVRGSLAAMLPELEPVRMPSTKYLLVETPSAWVAVISQMSSLDWVEYFARRMRTRVVRTSFAPHVARKGVVRRYGSVSFTMTDGARDDLPSSGVRSIQASHQGSSWHWHLGGETQPFEELDAYREKRVRSRFDLPRLNRYCHALGIRRDDVAFYGPRATLIEADTSRWLREPEPGVPSAQWRAEHE